MLEFLKGKKTYICAVAIALVVAAQQLGWVSADVAQTLFGLLGAGGLASLRSSVSNLE